MASAAFSGARLRRSSWSRRRAVISLTLAAAGYALTLVAAPDKDVGCAATPLVSSNADLAVGKCDVGPAWGASAGGPGAAGERCHDRRIRPRPVCKHAGKGLIRTLSVSVRDFARLEPWGARKYGGQARS